MVEAMAQAKRVKHAKGANTRTTSYTMEFPVTLWGAFKALCALRDQTLLAGLHQLVREELRRAAKSGELVVGFEEK